MLQDHNMGEYPTLDLRKCVLYLVEPVQESFGLLLDATRHPPLCHQLQILFLELQKDL